MQRTVLYSFVMMNSLQKHFTICILNRSRKTKCVEHFIDILKNNTEMTILVL